MENPVIQQLRQELQVECLAREKAEQTLDVKTSELNTIRTNWTTTARELDQLRVSTAPKSLILTDDHLRDKLALLRYQTRNLAILYFDGDLTQAAKANPTSLLDPYLKPTTPGTNTYEILLNSSNAAQKVVRAYIWRVLVGEVFGQFLWAGDIGQHMAVIGSLLRPSGDPPDPVAERKFALWSNDTTQILLDALGLRIEAEGHDVRYATPRVKTLVSLILETISPFLREKEGQLQTTLLEIVDAAIKLDKEMCQQITRLTWVFGDMEAGTVVLAPGLKRRGRSDGKEFETEKVVLIKEISLEPGLKMGKVVPVVVPPPKIPGSEAWAYIPKPHNPPPDPGPSKPSLAPPKVGPQVRFVNSLSASRGAPASHPSHRSRTRKSEPSDAASSSKTQAPDLDPESPPLLSFEPVSLINPIIRHRLKTQGREPKLKHRTVTTPPVTPDPDPVVPPVTRPPGLNVRLVIKRGVETVLVVIILISVMVLFRLE